MTGRLLLIAVLLATPGCGDGEERSPSVSDESRQTRPRRFVDEIRGRLPAGTTITEGPVEDSSPGWIVLPDGLRIDFEFGPRFLYAEPLRKKDYVDFDSEDCGQWLVHFAVKGSSRGYVLQAIVPDRALTFRALVPDARTEQRVIDVVRAILDPTRPRVESR